MKYRFLWVSSCCGCFKPETAYESESDRAPHTPQQELNLTTVQSGPENQQMCQDSSSDEQPSLVLTAFSAYFQLTVAGRSEEMGLVRYQSGAEYRGECEKGERHGEGEMRWSSDTWYRGCWRDGMPAGKGMMQIRPGVRFEGEWTNCFYSPTVAKPTLLASFDQWLYAVDDGYGTFHSVWLWFETQRGHLPQIRPQPPSNPFDLFPYITDLTASVTEYLSVMDDCWAKAGEGSVMCGKFLQLRYCSQLYSGCHDSKKADGIGRLVLKPGLKYEGEWVNGQRKGFGVYYWPNGKVMAGFWQEGKQHGPCLLQEPGKERELAVWESGRKVRILELDRSL